MRFRLDLKRHYRLFVAKYSAQEKRAPARCLFDHLIGADEDRYGDAVGYGAPGRSHFTGLALLLKADRRAAPLPTPWAHLAPCHGRGLNRSGETHPVRDLREI